MKGLFLLAGATLGLGLQGSTFAADVLDLETAFAKAQAQSPNIAMQASKVDQAREGVRQGVALMLPKIDALGTYSKVDESSLNSAQRDAYDESQTAARVSLRQPLFSGFKDWAVYAAAKEQLKASELTEKNEARLLYAKLLALHYEILALQSDAANLNKLLDLTKKRVKELTSRAQIGRARRSELSQTLASQASLDAQITNNKTLIASAFAKYTALSGVSSNVTLAPSKHSQNKSTNLSEEKLLHDAQRNRLDLAAAEAQARSQESQIKAARRTHLPTLDLGANYHLLRPEGTLEDSKWDLTLTLTLPLYAGGGTSSQVRAAAAKHSELESQKALLLQDIKEEISTAFASWSGKHAQIADLERVVNLYEQSYQEIARDNNNGIASNLEVLQALNSAQDAKRSYDRARIESERAYLELQIATGALP